VDLDPRWVILLIKRGQFDVLEDYKAHVIDQALTLLKAHDDIGDFASGVLLAAEWSSSVQHDKGQAIGTAAARDTADCLAGSFTSSLDPDNQSSSSTQISLSPGDLDEVVRMLVAADSNGGDRGTAFSRVAAFRTGYFQGADACKA